MTQTSTGGGGEITKSEFLTELQNRGTIDIATLPTTAGTNKWFYGSSDDVAIYVGSSYSMFITGLSTTNPPSDVSSITFVSTRGDVDSLPRDWALARLNELPFVSGGGGGAPKNFDDWVAGKGGKSAIKGKDISELVDAYSGIAPLGFTVTGGNVSTAVDYYTGIG